jgi:hypothetical protein
MIKLVRTLQGWRAEAFGAHARQWLDFERKVFPGSWNAMDASLIAAHARRDGLMVKIGVGNAREL